VTAATSRSSTPPGAARRSQLSRARPAAQQVPLYAQVEELHIASWPCFGLYRDFAHQLSTEANTAATQVYAIEGGSFVLMATQVISPAGIDLSTRHYARPDATCLAHHREPRRAVVPGVTEATFS
jgi:hypothetical protein